MLAPPHPSSAAEGAGPVPSERGMGVLTIEAQIAMSRSKSNPLPISLHSKKLDSLALMLFPSITITRAYPYR